MGRLAMNDERDSKTEANGEPATPVRRPWHAPKFIVSRLASTYAVSNAGTDIPITIGTSLS
jgi:hypothetical protein